jgi:hypothetical protein
VSPTASAATSFFDPSQARKALAGLLGGASTARIPKTPVSWLEAGGQAGDEQTDWRVKASVGQGSRILYEDTGNSLMKPIQDTGGVIFPITPQIQMTHTAKYNSQPLAHSNYAMHFYEGSEIGQIQVNGDFPVQTVEEGQYLLAAIYFFRAATKMFWGSEGLAGTPPPMLFLTGYGTHYFPNVPCVLTQFMHTMPHDGDFIEVPTPGPATNGKSGKTRLPTYSTLQCQFQPIYSRDSLTEFTLSQFAKGDLLKGGFV